MANEDSYHNMHFTITDNTISSNRLMIPLKSITGIEIKRFRLLDTLVAIIFIIVGIIFQSETFKEILSSFGRNSTRLAELPLYPFLGFIAILFGIVSGVRVLYLGIPRMIITSGTKEYKIGNSIGDPFSGYTEIVLEELKTEIIRRLTR